MQTPFAAGAGTAAQNAAYPNGGTEIDTGTDDGMGVFADGGDVTTTYVCDGATGPTPTITPVTASLGCTNPCSLNVFATCPAGTLLTGCFASPTEFCDGDVIQAQAVIGNACVVDYLHASTVCGSFDLTLKVTAECMTP